MADERETDFLAYILCGLIIAISGIAVGVASTGAPAPSPARECAASGQQAFSGSPCADSSAARPRSSPKD
jgi:hypothetical protein